MSTRKIPLLSKEEFYHIFNRGAGKRRTFMNGQDFQRFFQSMDLFNTTEPIGSLYAHSFQLRSEAPK